MKKTSFDWEEGGEDQAAADGENGISAGQEEEFIQIPRSKAELIKKMLANLHLATENLMQFFDGGQIKETEAMISIGQLAENLAADGPADSDFKVIEGVFDGENMVGPDGKVYSVPANYASKSKLVEGDIMKLTITDKGTFVYKQIGPIDRNRLIGNLEKDGDGNYYVLTNGKRWKVLTASVTYFKGGVGDEAVILVPKTGDSKWAAIENIVHL